MPLSHSVLIRHASRLGSAFRFGLGRGFGGPLGLGIMGGLVDRLRALADCGGFIGVGKHDPCTFNLGPGSPDSISSYLGGLLGLVAGSLNRGYRGIEAFLGLVQELDEAEKLGIREVAAVRLGVDRVGEGLGLGGEGLLVGGHPKEAELLGGADSGVAIDEDASAIGLLPDVDGLGRIEAVGLDVGLDRGEDLGLDREERGEGLGLGDLVEEELDTDCLVA